MFHLTLSQSISNIFEGFCILKRHEEVKCLFSFPANYSFQKFYQFIFPCNCVKEKSEEYCIVISNASNDRSFLLCRYSELHQLYLCVYSHNPWFEILSKLLLNLCHGEFMPNKFHSIRVYLQKVHDMSEENKIILPPCNANDNTAQQILKNSLKFPYIYDKYIQEYLTAIKPSSGYNKKLWLEVFWSMLLERPIIFMSKRYQKLTSSLLAATFFIHPLSWLHKFVSIIPQKNPELLGMNCCMLGIHSCMEPILESTEFWNEALLVDLDKGESKMVGACEDEKETHSRFKVPKYIRNFFISHIQMVDESISINSPHRIKDIISNTPWHINKDESMYNEYKKGFHIYPLLFRTIIIMIMGNYREFISLRGFEKEKFILSNPKLTDFLRIFVQSQCFDSFIDEKLKCFENSQDMQDRFDKERQELHTTTKIPTQKVKEKKQLKATDKLPKRTPTSISLSSSTSSININNVPKENHTHIALIKSQSVENNLSKGFSERLNLSKKHHLTTVVDSKNVLVPPNSRINDGVPLNVNNNNSRTKPSRPIFKPGEAPPGIVHNIVEQINQGKLESNMANANRKRSMPQIKPSELPPGNKPVAQLTSMFEVKPIV